MAASLDWVWVAAGWTLGAVGVLLLGWALLWDRARGRRRCPKCWYDMRSIEAAACDPRSREPRVFRCPECGRAAWSSLKLVQTRRRWRWSIAAAALLLVAWGVVTAHGVSRGWSSRKLNAIPHPLLRIALWACCSWDGGGEPPAANALGGNPTFGQLRAPSQTVAEQWNALLAAYRLGRAIERASPGTWRSSSPINGWPEAPIAFEYILSLEALGANAWPAAGTLVRVVEDRIPVDGAAADHAAAFHLAMRVFMSMGDEAVEGLPGLIRRALREDTPQSPTLVATIAAVSPRPALSLTELLESRCERVVLCSLEELAARKTGGSRTGAAVGRVARAGRTSILRVRAIEALEAVDPRGKGAIRDLTVCLEDPDPSVRVAAADALARLSSREPGP